MRDIRPVSIVIIIVLAASVFQVSGQVTHTPIFDGESAYGFLTGQCDFGPRPPGSENLTQCTSYIIETLESFNWTITIQNFTYMNTACANIIATWNGTTDSPIILGAHYDTRPNATKDSSANQALPILGANDGASGTAVLMELARILPISERSKVELVFFDAEDSGGLNGWDWIQGSTYYVSQLTTHRKDTIEAMALVDMVGDADLYLPKEGSSTDSLQNVIWSIAADLGYGNTFIDTSGSSITDDHRPFLDAGIPAVDIIQVPFPSYWHTLEDTTDKCSAESLEIVGEVLEVFVVQYDSENGGFPPDTPYILYATLIAIALIILFVLYQRKKQ
ncbi:MAG: M28 family peptidase [Candidatus Thorarchaeota archaeon]|nr:MAG: M28 family peptidase [Candidatus Thorarchaeota archaeon]